MYVRGMHWSKSIDHIINGLHWSWLTYQFLLRYLNLKDMDVCCRDLSLNLCFLDAYKSIISLFWRCTIQGIHSVYKRRGIGLGSRHWEWPGLLNYSWNSLYCSLLKWLECLLVCYLESDRRNIWKIFILMSSEYFVGQEMKRHNPISWLSEGELISKD